MKVLNIDNSKVGVLNSLELLKKHFETEQIDLAKGQWVGKRRLEKGDNNYKILPPPYSMSKLLKMLDRDEYHYGCVDAKVSSSLMQFETSNEALKTWLEDASYPGNEDIISLLSEFLKYYLSCGNGFLLKMRNRAGKWIGLERLVPSEIRIIEKYDKYGFFKPDYLHIKNYKKKVYSGDDVIHLKASTHLSSSWGVACLPIATNIAILDEIKTFDYNNFSNGLLIDYFIIVEGGTLRDDILEDEEGNEVLKDAYTVIKEAIQQAKGNSKSHSTVLIETENKDTHIRLEPMRQQERDGGFIKLKKDLREGIFSYHRVPPRIVSQLVAGQLGGDNKSDMIMFYNFVIKPQQNRLKSVLTNELNNELKMNLKASEIDFGDLTMMFETEDEKIFKSLKQS